MLYVTVLKRHIVKGGNLIKIVIFATLPRMLLSEFDFFKCKGVVVRSRMTAQFGAVVLVLLRCQQFYHYCKCQHSEERTNKSALF